MKITKNLIRSLHFILTLYLGMQAIWTLWLFLQLTLVSMGALESSSENKFSIKVNEVEEYMRKGFIEAGKQGWEDGYKSGDSPFKNLCIPYELSYEINGKKYPSTKTDNEISTIEIKDNSYRGRLLRGLELLFINALILLLIFEIRKIFGILKYASNTNEWFSKIIYKSLMKISFYYIGISIIPLIINLIYMSIIDNIWLNGKELYSTPSFPRLDTIIIFIFIFMVAQVYKAGIELKEEQELTV